MNCHDFEIALWEYPSKFVARDNLTPEMDKHLVTCSNCSQVYSNYCRLFEISAKAEISVNDDFGQKFESKVWNKIDHIESSKKINVFRFKSRPEIGLKPLIASLGVAISAVLLMFLAVSDITRQMPETGKSLPEITKGRSPSGVTSKKLTRTYNVVFNEQPKISIQLQEYSILPEPKIEMIDTTALVAIDAVYLTDEGIKEEQIEIAHALNKSIVRGDASLEMSREQKRSLQIDTTGQERVITLEKMPVMKKMVAPKYPSIAYNLKKQGELWIKTRVDFDGKVTNALIYKDSGTDYGFEDEAIKAAYLCEFEPFEIDNKPVPVWVIYKVRFVIKE